MGVFFAIVLLDGLEYPVELVVDLHQPDRDCTDVLRKDLISPLPEHRHIVAAPP